MRVVRTTLIVALVITLVPVAFVVLFPKLPESSTVTRAKDVTQAAQALITGVALIAGGMWAYYRFVVEGNLATNLKIELKSNRVVDQLNEEGEAIGKIAVVSVMVKNAGRVPVEIREVRFGSEPITRERLLAGAGVMDNLLNARYARWYFISRILDRLDPQQETATDVLVFLDAPVRFLKVAVQFRGRRIPVWDAPGPEEFWASRASFFVPAPGERDEGAEVETEDGRS